MATDTDTDTGTEIDIDLSLKDVKFLRAVRDINANPEAYSRTESGEVPATTGAIIDGFDLSESEVRYRMGGSRHRGFEEAGLTVVYDAEFDEETKTFGAKSVELTDTGIDVLGEFEEANEVFESEGEDDETPEVVKQLRARVDKLEERTVSGGSGSADIQREVKSIRNDIERLETKVDGIREDPWGGLDDDVMGHTKETIQETQGIRYILETVFGIDVERRIEDGSYPSEAALEVERAEIATLLSEAEMEGGGMSPGGGEAASIEAENGDGDGGGDGESDNPQARENGVGQAELGDGERAVESSREGIDGGREPDPPESVSDTDE